MLRRIFDWCADTSLVEGCREGDVFKLLDALNNGADPDYAQGLPLLSAVRAEQSLSVFFLEKCVNLNVRNGLPLIMAVAMRNRQQANYLLGARASSVTNVFGKGMDGHLEEALAVARATRSREMERWLMARGAMQPRAELSACEVEKAVFHYDETAGVQVPYVQLAAMCVLVACLSGMFGNALYENAECCQKADKAMVKALVPGVRR